VLLILDGKWDVGNEAFQRPSTEGGWIVLAGHQTPAQAAEPKER
jgi:hypothetical protein